MATNLPLLDMLCADKSGAIRALEAAGCILEPDLQTSIEHPMIGTIQRVFGVVRNLAVPDSGGLIGGGGYGQGRSTDADAIEGGRHLGERLLRSLDDPDNERVATRLLDGVLSFMPANKTLAARVRRTVGLRGAHLPWSFQALNLGLSMKVEKSCAHYGFVVFYSEDAKFDEALGLNLGRIFTTPFGVEGFGTWQEPISQDILDEDVGLILEANWLGAP